MPSGEDYAANQAPNPSDWWPSPSRSWLGDSRRRTPQTSALRLWAARRSRCPPHATVGSGCRRLTPSRGPTDSPGPLAPWPKPPAAAAAAPPASCNANAHRPRSRPRRPASLAVARRRRWLCRPGHPGAAPALPPPPRSGLQPIGGDQPPALGTGCSCRDPGCGQPAKHPLGSLVPHGVKDATTNRARVLAWWTRHPQANIGLACGHRFDGPQPGQAAGRVPRADPGPAARRRARGTRPNR